MVTWKSSAVCLLLGASVAFAQGGGQGDGPRLEVESDQPGDSPSHHLHFALEAGQLEVHRAVLTYPVGFRFNGFDALGPPNTQVGAYALDFNADGVAEHTVALRSLTSASAYADVIEDQEFTPAFEPILDVTGVGRFHLRLPFGGDARRDTITVPFTSHVTVTLFGGLITNPPAGGAYEVRAELTSVDPDTGDADNGTGAAPMTQAFTAVVTIVGRPVFVPFARFRIGFASVLLNPAHGDRVDVAGHYVLGAASDGVNLRQDDVIVRFGDFTQRIPGRAFRRGRRGYHYQARAGTGVRSMTLHASGHFEITAWNTGARSQGLRGPITVGLQIGDDRGEATIRLDRNGRYRGHLRERKER